MNQDLNLSDLTELKDDSAVHHRDHLILYISIAVLILTVLVFYIARSVCLLPRQHIIA